MAICFDEEVPTTMNTTHAQASRSDFRPSTGLRRRRRSVAVRVLDGEREVDGFEVSDIQSLRSALRPIYAHAGRDVAVRLMGLEDESLPFGVARTRREVAIDDAAAAQGFLAGLID